MLIAKESEQAAYCYFLLLNYFIIKDENLVVEIYMCLYSLSPLAPIRWCGRSGAIWLRSGRIIQVDAVHLWCFFIL